MSHHPQKTLNQHHLQIVVMMVFTQSQMILWMPVFI